MDHRLPSRSQRMPSGTPGLITQNCRPWLSVFVAAHVVDANEVQVLAAVGDVE